MKFGKLILRKIVNIVAQNLILAGALPQTPMGELTALTQTS